MNYTTVLRAMLALACVTSTTACSNPQREAETTVRHALKDPDSARFGDFYYNKGTGKACLTVNAKNSMGGYTGDMQVSLRHHDSGWEYVEEAEISQADCKENFADKP